MLVHPLKPRRQPFDTFFLITFEKTLRMSGQSKIPCACNHGIRLRPARRSFMRSLGSSARQARGTSDLKYKIKIPISLKVDRSRRRVSIRIAQAMRTQAFSSESNPTACWRPVIKGWASTPLNEKMKKDVETIKTRY